MMTAADALANSDIAPLRLLVSSEPERRSDRVLLLSLSRACGADAIARSLFASVERGSWRLFPSPRPDGDLTAQRAWHRDLWLGMPSVLRESAVAAIGPSVAHLAPILGP